MRSNFLLSLNKEGLVDFGKLKTLNLIHFVGSQSGFVHATKIDILFQKKILIRKITLNYTLCYTLYFEFHLKKRHIRKVTLSYKVLGKHKVNQGLTTFTIQLWVSPLIEH
jgi:uncharacterized membrane protein